MKSKSNRFVKRLQFINILLIIVLLAIVVGLLVFGGDADSSAQSSSEAATQSMTVSKLETSSVTSTTDSSVISSETSSITQSQTSSVDSSESFEKKLIVIDAGHQLKGNYDKEPIGPNATELKAKVTSGTDGVVTKLEEYELNLTVAKKLQKILEERGYEVVMVRTTHDVDISNAERAKIANDLNADAFIRIHANSSDNAQTNGILTICQTKNSPYNKELYKSCYSLSENVLDAMVATTKAKRLRVWETDTMSGINWCKVPVTIVEMGYMSNEEEDRKMATDSYQDLLAQGIANGIDNYFESIE